MAVSRPTSIEEQFQDYADMWEKISISCITSPWKLVRMPDSSVSGD